MAVFGTPHQPANVPIWCASGCLFVWCFLLSVCGFVFRSLRHATKNALFCSLRHAPKRPILQPPHTTTQTRGRKGNKPHPPRPMPAGCWLRGSLLHRASFRSCAACAAFVCLCPALGRCKEDYPHRVSLKPINALLLTH